MDACVCQAESLRRSPGTVTALITGRTPLQHVFGVKKEGKKEALSPGQAPGAPSLGPAFGRPRSSSLCLKAHEGT